MNSAIPSNKNCHKTYLNYSLILIVLAAIGFSSCSVPKNAYYFKTLPKDTIFNLPPVGESKIRKNDLLSINISSLNKEEDMTYNAAAGGAVAAGAGAGSVGGYLVDADGNIQYHRLGKIHVEGITRRALKEKIQTDLLPYLKDPIVTVRYLNHRITVMGEVAKPSVIQMPEEQLSLLEVLATSGDVSLSARRDNILVIRETGNGKQLKRINLEDKSIFTSEWYYLQPDDVVYVEPNDKKIKEEKRNKQNQIISMALAGVSTAIIILDRIFR